MSKHTPGPWRVSLTDDTVVVDASGNEVAAIDGDYNQPDTWPAMEANARLIAAAPDLLKALCDCLSWHNDADNLHKPIEVRAAYMRARAAIAKAKGEA